MEAKIGPSTEVVYDALIRDLGLDIGFAYLIDAYALGTKQPEKVIHYIPNHKGKTGGQRLFLDEPLSIAESKILLGPEESSHYLLRLASIAGYHIGKNYLTKGEIDNLHGKKLKKITKNLVLENILKPYKEVVQNEN